MRVSLLICLALMAQLGVAAQPACQVDNPQLQAMPDAVVTVQTRAGSQFEFNVRLANTPTTRAAGFQHVCAEEIARLPILFIFQRAAQPRFHMNNVVAPIDIAFIKSNGEIESVQAMQPYVMGARRKPLYFPAQPVTAALEANPGFFKANSIAVGDRMSWRLVPVASQQ
ncbi:MAG: DUF192 domain-containing protein [Gammaproteobacteria bacterium]|nr:DUF192 domain-containing protein [Gammaproteobacteria bacterium]